MIKLVQTKLEGRDGTSWYNVWGPKDYTVQNFIKCVLKQYKDSWGNIVIEKEGQQIYSCSYAYGKLKSKSKITNLIKGKKIISATANGGYSFLTFYVTVLD